MLKLSIAYVKGRAFQFSLLCGAIFMMMGFGGWLRDDGGGGTEEAGAGFRLIYRR